jgi:RNA 3'-terminal phosphate cyclase (ATP)
MAMGAAMPFSSTPPGHGWLRRPASMLPGCARVGAMGEEVPILFDGSQGAGGGTLLRTALSLSCLTGRPFGISRLRAGRAPTGLQPHHLELVRAAARLCAAELSGDTVGGERFSFSPRRSVVSGDWRFELSGAGSATLLLQTLCWPLALAGGTSTLHLSGATHQEGAPSFHQLALVWAPAMARLGFRFELGLQAAGFNPEGGGALTARIEPAHPMPPLDLRYRGLLQEVEVLAMVGGMPYADAAADAANAQRALTGLGVASEAERLVLPVRGSRGRHTLLVASFERIRSGHGATRAGDRAGEGSAEEAVASLRQHLASGGAVDPLLAEQLLLPAGLVAARRVEPPAGLVPVTRYTTSGHGPALAAVAAVIRRFLDVEVSVVGHLGEEVEVRIQPPGSGVELLPLPAG